MKIDKPDEHLLWKYHQLSHEDLVEPTKSPKIGWEYCFNYENDNGELRVGVILIGSEEEANAWKEACESSDSYIWEVKKESE